MGSDGIALDITGCAHLQGGEAALRREAVERLEGQGIAARAAIADTSGAAWALARFGARGVVPRGRRMPGAGRACRSRRSGSMPWQTAELERLGLRRIGDLYPLQRAGARGALRRRGGAPSRSGAGRGGGAALAAAAGAAALGAPPLRRADRDAGGDRRGGRRAARDAVPRARREERWARAGSTLTCYRVDGDVGRGATIGTARPSREPPPSRYASSPSGSATIDPGLGIEDMVLAATVVERLAAAQIEIELQTTGQTTTTEILGTCEIPLATQSGRAG